jgi:hypothetical protein
MQGWHSYFNDDTVTGVLPIPGRPNGAGNLGNTGNVWANFGLNDLPLNLWDEVDALDTFGDIEDPNSGGWLFSVDAASIGAPGSGVANVHNQVFAPNGGPRDQAGSIFQAAAVPAGNQWAIDGKELGLYWPGPPGCDNLDAYDYNPTPNGQLIFSLANGSPALFGPDAIFGTADDLSGADVFYYDVNIGPLSLVRTPAANYGLLPGDDIDALVRLDPVLWPNAWCFSLAPGSPTLALFPNGSPADTYWSNGFGGLWRGATAAQLGLNIYDNVDALDTGCLQGGGPYGYFGESPSTSVNPFLPLSDAEMQWFAQHAAGNTVPEPATLVLLVAGIFLAVGARNHLVFSRK